MRGVDPLYLLAFPWDCILLMLHFIIYCVTLLIFFLLFINFHPPVTYLGHVDAVILIDRGVLDLRLQLGMLSFFVFLCFAFFQAGEYPKALFCRVFF